MPGRAPEDAVDAQLRRAFAPPPAADFAAMAGEVATPAPVTTNRWWPTWIAAAALLAVVLTMFLRDEVRGPEGHDGRALGALWAAAYEDAMARGFSGGCCETGFDLAGACDDRYSCRVEVSGDGALSVLGSYCGLETGGCMAVLARDGAMPICIVIVPRDQDPAVELPADSRLQLTRRDLGDVVLYALSSEVADRALAQFVVL